MMLSSLQIWVMIGLITIGTMITRFLPFIIFPESKEPPKFVLFLSNCLPAATMGLLVVYCLKNVNLFGGQYGIPEAISIIGIVVVHKWKNNVLLSILGGTALYVLLIHLLPYIGLLN